MGLVRRAANSALRPVETRAECSVFSSSRHTFAGDCRACPAPGAGQLPSDCHRLQAGGSRGRAGRQGSNGGGSNSSAGAGGHGRSRPGRSAVAQVGGVHCVFLYCGPSVGATFRPAQTPAPAPAARQVCAPLIDWIAFLTAGLLAACPPPAAAGSPAALRRSLSPAAFL